MWYREYWFGVSIGEDSGNDGSDLDFPYMENHTSLLNSNNILWQLSKVIVIHNAVSARRRLSSVNLMNLMG